VTLPVRTPARSTGELVLPADVATPGDPCGEVLVVTAQDSGAMAPGDPRGLWFFVEDRDLALVGDAVTATAEETDDGHLVHVVHVEATALVKDLALLVDVLDPGAVVDDMLITLLPGERATFRVTGTVVDPQELLGPPVLRCVNDLLVGRR